MYTQQILDSDWSDYDNRKKRGGSDHNNFSCTENWEVDYLVKKIKDQHPQIAEATIRTAIDGCCKIVVAPHPRKTFVPCVMQRLGIG